jgi:hypothetical protein
VGEAAGEGVIRTFVPCLLLLSGNDGAHDVPADLLRHCAQLLQGLRSKTSLPVYLSIDVWMNITGRHAHA